MEVLDAMIERIDHSPWGQPRRRVFHDVAWDASLEQDLQSAADSGRIHQFKHGDGGLVVLRPWVEGADVRDVRDLFRDATFVQRRGHSRELFAEVIDHLGERAHGAVHPGNMLKVGEGLVLFDWVANVARLRTVPPPSETYDLWLWQPHCPEGWKVQDWDRVNLLRMAALLENGPPWKDPLPFLEMIDRCRSWAEAYIGGLKSGDDMQAELRGALRLLEILQPPKPVQPPEHPLPEIEKLLELEEHLETLFRQNGHRILFPVDEKVIYQKFGVEAPILLAVALSWKGAEKLEDVTKAAKAFLSAGVYEKSRIVRNNACRNAERLFVGLGLPSDEAEVLVRQLLASDGLKDNRTVQDVWVREVEKFLSKHCGRQRQVSQRQFSQMAKIVAGFDLPDPWAKMQLRQYLDQNQAIIKPSLFGL